jgi:pimeloyl-ACP methyl ester carboxylesterase
MSLLATPGGYRLRYAHRNLGASPTIVLVHGWRRSHRIWDVPLYRFADAGFEVIAFDNRGMGESDKPVGDDDYDVDVLAGDLAFVLERLAVEDVILLGWSMGCSIALRYLQRVGSRAGKLVFVSGPVSLVATERLPWGFERDALQRYLESVVAAFPRAEPSDGTDVMPPASLWRTWPDAITLQTPLEAAMRIVAEQAKLDFTDFMCQVEIPTLALYGSQDPFYDPALAHWIAAEVPDGRAVVVEGSAPAVHIDASDRFVEVVTGFAAGAI